MKKFLLSLIALLGVVSANAQELSIADVEVVPGSQATFAIKLTNETDVRFRDSEFHFTFPAGISPVSAASGDQNIEPGTNTVGDDYRLTIAAMSDAQSQGIAGNFTVCYVTIEAKAGLAEGTYTATLTKAEMTGNGEQIPGTSNYEIVKKNYENIEFDIIVSKTVTLDENSTTAPVAIDGVNAWVKRSIKAGQWSTICLPFAMSEEQVQSAFGEGAELADFNGIGTLIRDDEGRISTIPVKFVSVSSMEANHPYILKATKDITHDEGFLVEEVSVNPTSSPVVKKDFVYNEEEDTNEPKSFFYGVYVPKVLDDNKYLFISGNKFYYSNTTTNMKGFRGYFKLRYVLNAAYKDISTSAGVKIYVDDEATGLDVLRMIDTAGAVYTIDGKFIGRDVDLKKLQKGIYVIDGKKVAIK